MAQIDSLEIKIEADASQAASSIKNLSNNLDGLKTAMSGVSGGGLTSLSNALGKIADVSSKINDDVVGKLGRLSDAIKGISDSFSQVNSTNAVELANGISTIVSAANGGKRGIDNILNIADGISKLDSVMSNSADYMKLTEIGNAIVNLSASASILNEQSGKNVQKLADSINYINKAVSVGTDYSPLDNLSKNLTIFAAGIQTLGDIDTSKINDLVSSINSISSINKDGQVDSASTSIKALTNALGSISAQQLTNKDVAVVYEFANALSMLGSSNVSNATTTIPLLTESLAEMINTLSQMPDVSDNVVRVVEALASFSKASSTVSKSSKTASSGISSMSKVTKELHTILKRTFKYLKKFGSAIKSAASHIKLFKKEAKSTESALKRFEKGVHKLINTIIRLRMVVGVMKTLFEWLNNSVDMIESVNYFNAAMNQVASKIDTSAWREAGYSSASEYANAFYEQYKKEMLSITEKMTGYTVQDDDKLISNGGKSLGMNPSTLLQYQTGFAQIASSMGVASDVAVTLSNAMIKLGSDIASVRNQDFEQVWQNLQSALVGQSRAVDKYGINIRNAALEEKAMQIGVQKTVSTMSQSEKALLRMIVILDSSKYAYGDLAETIQSPANQLRLLKENINNLGRAVANTILPVFARLLPILNSITVALQKLFEYILKLLSVYDTWANFDWGGSTDNGSLDELIGEIEDVDDSLDDAIEKSEELKRSILGFDEINALGSSTDSLLDDVSGGDSDLQKMLDAFNDAIAEYENAWNKAFDNMVETSTKFAEDVAEAFRRSGLYGVGEFLAKSINDALRSINWESIYEGASLVGKKIAEFLNGFINEDLAYTLGRDLINKLNTAMHLLNGFLKEFDYKNLGRTISSGLQGIFENIDWSLIHENAVRLAIGISEVVNNAFSETTLKEFGNAIGNYVNTIIYFLGNLFSTLDWSGIGSAIREGFIELVNTIDFGSLINTAIDLGTGLADFLNNLITPESMEKLGVVVVNALNTIIEGVYAFFEELDGEQASDSIATFFNTVLDRLETDKLGIIIGKLSHILAEAIRKVDKEDLKSAINEMVLAFFEESSVSDLLTVVSPFVTVALIPSIVKAIALAPFTLIKTAFQGKIATAIGKGFAEGMTGTAATTAVGGGIKSLFSFATLKIAGSIALIGGAVRALINVGKWIGETLFPDKADAISEFDLNFSNLLGWFKDGFNSWQEGIKAFTNGDFADAGKYILEGILGGIKTAIAAPFTLAVEIFDWIWGGLKGVFKWGSPAKAMYPAGENIMWGLSEGILQHLEDFKETFGEVFDAVWGYVKDFTEKFHDKIQSWVEKASESFDTWKENVKTHVSEFVETTEENIGKWVEDTSEKFSSWSSDAKSKFDDWKENVISSVSTFAESTHTTISGWVDNVKERFSSFKEDASSRFSEWKEDVSQRVQEFSDENGSKIENFVQNAKDGFADMGDSIGESFHNAYETGSSWFASLRDYVGGMKFDWSGLTDSLGSAFDKIGDAFGTVGAYIGGKWDSLKNKFSSAASKLKSWFSGNSYSTGGFPENGLFFANSTELVGKFSNGKTAVANNNQIIEGIKQGVTDALMDVYMATNSGSTQSANTQKVEIPIYIDGKEVARGTFNNLEAMIRNGQLKPVYL